jgi:hypothetical protein
MFQSIALARAASQRLRRALTSRKCRAHFHSASMRHSRRSTLPDASNAKRPRAHASDAQTMTMAVASNMDVDASPAGLRAYYKAKIESMEVALSQKTQNLRRLEAQRNELNGKGARVVRMRVIRVSWLARLTVMTA